MCEPTPTHSSGEAAAAAVDSPFSGDRLLREMLESTVPQPTPLLPSPEPMTPLQVAARQYLFDRMAEIVYARGSAADTDSPTLVRIRGERDPRTGRILGKCNNTDMITAFAAAKAAAANQP
jgi:hypothetical protein